MTYIPYDDLINFKYKLYCKGTLIDASDDVEYIKALKKEMEEIDKEDGVYKYGSYKITFNIVIEKDSINFHFPICLNI